MIGTTPSTGRAAALRAAIDDAAGAERLARLRDRTSARICRLLSEGYTAAEVDQAEAWRCECRWMITLAAAASDAIWVSGGRVECRGTRAEEFTRRLERFNRVPAGHRRSLAALQFAELMGGER